MDALPPDPYAALGVARDATAGAIKSQYRKLVLKHHPDKIQDDSLKRAAADEFHKVQSAYEIVGDDERRQRYDAQCKLAQLRRDAMERACGGSMRGEPDVRTAGFRFPTESPRGGDFYARGPERGGPTSPQYEERRPTYPEFYESPRPSSRKNADFERSSKRASPREESKKSRSSAKKSKENERSSREEKSRRSDQETRKDRDRKFAFVSEEQPSSDSDEYERERVRRQRRDEDEMREWRRRAAMEEEARDARRRKDDEAAAASFFGSERAHKLYTQDMSAREYMARGATSPQERTPADRPSPVRNASSREDVEYISRDGGRPPIQIRRGSGRIETSRREPRQSSPRDREPEIVDEPQEAPRKPSLKTMSSDPAPATRPPFERQRSSSLQNNQKDLPPPPVGIKRAETMPYQSTTSKLRTEVPQAYPTPEPSPEPPVSRKHSYGKVYADDGEYPTPDGYRTEYREPSGNRKEPRTTSPKRSPVRESREKSSRAASAKYAAAQPPPNKRTTSKTYVYAAPAEANTEPRRPSLPREGSSGNVLLPYEITGTRSPKPTSGAYSPPPESVKYAPRPRSSDIRTSSGYTTREMRPSRHEKVNSRHRTEVF